MKFLAITILFIISTTEALIFKSVSNASIVTLITEKKFEELSFQKFERNDSALISLNFKLSDIGNAVFESLVLKVNGKVERCDILKANVPPSKTQFMYVIKEEYNNTINYEINFLKVKYIQSGSYELTLKFNTGEVSAVGYAFLNPIAKEFNKPKLGLAGDPMHIICKYDSFPKDVEIKWKKLSGNIDSTKPGNITKGILLNATDIVENDDFSFRDENKTLFFKSLKSSDVGLYICEVILDNYSDISVVKVVVKDRWAAIYPFIGIVIEVIILVTFILVLEKYQLRTQNKNSELYDVADEENKEPGIPLTTTANEDATAPPNAEAGDSPDVKINNSNSNLRQRPPNPEA